jgi:hypothetical protein
MPGINRLYKMDREVDSSRERADATRKHCLACSHNPEIHANLLRML